MIGLETYLGYSFLKLTFYVHLLAFACLRRENGLEAILHDPSRIWDTDETGVHQLAPGKRKVLA